MRLLATALSVLLLAAQEPDTWRGIPIAAEKRCAPYQRKDYPYSQALEDSIIDELGAIISPYTCETFRTKGETQIEHIVALSEAHDSGLCARSLEERRRFASDLRNLTLASPQTNRAKGAQDAADWRPTKNACWFAETVVSVRKAYKLTIDRREVAALDRIIKTCKVFEIRCSAL